MDSFDGNVKDYRLSGGSELNSTTYIIYNGNPVIQYITGNSGSYRHLIVRPENTTAEVVQYASNEEDLLTSEKETLKGFNPPTENTAVDQTKEKTKTGIIINFTLPTSAYATMALREFMNFDQTE